MQVHMFILKLTIDYLIKQEICSNPEFIVNEANRFDLDQGQLGEFIF